MDDKCSCLAKLKEDYLKLMKKYNLPSFKELNEEFGIEKIQELETDTLLREIRKIIMDKVIAYLRFIEMLLNPQNAPLFFFSLLKNVENSERKMLEEIYSKLGKIEIEVIDVDNDYKEEKEVNFIKHIIEEWKPIKEDMNKISKFLVKGWEKKTRNKEKSYLG